MESETGADSERDQPIQAPVAADNRIQSLDILRGFALCGVLVMNMQAFADVFAVYINPYATGEISRLDYLCWCFNHVVADAKFITIFSMLFGAGIALMTSRAKERTGRSTGLHYRRMFWMLLFGLAHVCLLWNGDILFLYGSVGLIAFWFRGVRPSIQISIAIFLFLIPPVFLSTLQMVPENELAEMREMWSPSQETVESIRASMLGSWLQTAEFRIGEWTEMLTFLLVFGWRLLGCMLLGMALYTTRVLSAARSMRFYSIMVFIGFGVGLPLSTYGVVKFQTQAWEMVYSMGVGSLFNYFGSLFTAIGWIGVVMVIVRAGFMRKLQRRFAAVGRLALSNYIMQSLICTTIYNGHGLGFFGSVDRIWQQVLSLAIISLQLWYSPIWLRSFRFGPLEWLWRSLTYWRRQPFRLAAAGGVQSESNP